MRLWFGFPNRRFALREVEIISLSNRILAICKTRISRRAGLFCTALVMVLMDDVSSTPVNVRLFQEHVELLMSWRLYKNSRDSDLWKKIILVSVLVLRLVIHLWPMVGTENTLSLVNRLSLEMKSETQRSDRVKKTHHASYDISEAGSTSGPGMWLPSTSCSEVSSSFCKNNMPLRALRGSKGTREYLSLPKWDSSSIACCLGLGCYLPAYCKTYHLQTVATNIAYATAS